MGDTVTASCLSPASVPASSLTWYVNSDTADPGSVAGPREMELLAQVRLLLSITQVLRYYALTRSLKCLKMDDLLTHLATDECF